MAFIELLKKSWEKNDSLVCVGLDPEISRFPSGFSECEFPIFDFNKAIIDATADLVCSFKPQCAHYAAEGAEDQLVMTISYIHENYPGIPVLLDSKRGDIGNTARLYAREAFERFQADAVTVNPYLGFDSIEPFLQYKDKGVFVLVRTSNPGARDLQDLDVGGKKLYEALAELVVDKWNLYGNLNIVVGATCPEEIAVIRRMSASVPLLVPGVGAQGGDAESVVKNGKNKDGTGLLINSSRGILYASNGPDFAEAARKAAQELRDEINKFR